MNREKIETVIKQINAATELLEDGNIPDLTDSDLNFNGFGYSVTGLDAFNKISTAYQTLDNLNYELQDILNTAAQNNE